MKPFVRDVLYGAGGGLLVGALLRDPKAGAAVGAVLWPLLRAEKRAIAPVAGLGDALATAQAAAREKVNSEAGSYALPSLPTTRSEAIMAFILLMRSAAEEDAKNASHYRTLARDAAYFYRASPIWNITAAARDLTRSAPRTHSVASEIAAGSKETGISRTAPKAPKKARRSRPASNAPAASAPAAAPPADFAPAEPMWVTYRWPLALGGTLIALVIGIELMPRHGAA